MLEFEPPRLSGISRDIDETGRPVRNHPTRDGGNRPRFPPNNRARCQQAGEAILIEQEQPI
jgi:hypothetical protein